MDNYNIITPKDNLPELEYEMNQWLQLPTDLKFRSNDDCIRLHGCTVPDYYNILKIGLIKAQDTADTSTSSSNLLKEDMDWVDLSEKIKQTETVTNNPYIVIITPVTNRDQTVDLYNMYLNLSGKNRRLSDYYSVEIWGLNVRNMYEYLVSKFETQDDAVMKRQSGEDQSNLKLIANAESVLNAIYDKWNKALLEHNYDEEFKYSQMESDIMAEANLNRATMKRLSEKCFNDCSIGDLWLPKYCPWFSINEMIELGIDPHTEFNNNLDYYKAVVEAYNNFVEVPSNTNKQNLLNLGWNPYVEPSEKSFKEAKQHQVDCIGFRLGVSESFDYDLYNDTDPKQYKDSELNYVVMQDAVNMWDTDKDLVRKMCTYYKNLGY